MRPSGAEDVQVKVAQDSEKPLLEIRAGLETPLRGEGSGNRFLRQVFRLFAIARHGPGESHQPRTHPNDLNGEIALFFGAPLTHGCDTPLWSREYPGPRGLELRLVARKCSHRLYNTAPDANFPG